MLKFLRSLFPLRKLSLKLLTLEVIALIALAVVPRAQTLVPMDWDYMVKGVNQVDFCFPHILKTTRVGHCYSLKVEHYSEESLCTRYHILLIELRRLDYMCGSRGGTGGPDPPGKLQKYKVP